MLSIFDENNVIWLWIVCSLYMTCFWVLSFVFKNGGMVDFAWPSTFTALALYLAYHGDGWVVRKYVLGGMYAICGCRFMFGWILRSMIHWEDRRWGLWRHYWSQGRYLTNPFGIRNLQLNFFFFYHAQSTGTVWSIMVPMYVAVHNPTQSFSLMEYLGIALWCSSFVWENIADMQLAQFKAQKQNRGKVCQQGLWAYSRHPNYFGEYLIWCAYVIFAWASPATWEAKCVLLTCPALAYWFLVYFTGVPITELASIEHRGQAYIDYQNTTNMIFPWKRSVKAAKAY